MTHAPAVPSGLAGTLNRYAALIRGMSIILLLLSVILVLRQLPFGRAVAALEGWVGGLGIWGPVVFGLLYVLAVVFVFPASALTLAAGALFGLVTGTVVVSVASTVGVGLTFLIARYLARDWVAKRLRRYPRFDAIDRAVMAGGWRIVALLRLSPAVPFNLQNYLYGLTGISFWACVLTSWVTMLPATFMYIYLGRLGRASVESAAGGHRRTPEEWAFLIVGLVTTVAVTVYITRLARRALREHAALPEPGNAEPAGGSEQDAKNGWPWATTALAVVALAALAAAVFVQLRPEVLFH